MTLFHSDNRNRNADTKHVYAIFEIAYTLVDFGAALCFIVGSVFFFYESLMIPGTWFFLVGSILFAVKPTLRLVRELKLISMGDNKDLADRLKQ